MQNLKSRSSVLFRAIGIPFRNVRSITDNTVKTDAGAVVVFYGFSISMKVFASQVWTQETGAIKGAAQTGGRWGKSLY